MADDVIIFSKRKQEMTDEKFIKQAKQKIIEKEFEHISHKDSEKPEDWNFEVKMIWYNYNDQTDNYIAVFDFSSISRDNVRYQVLYLDQTNEFLLDRYSMY